MHASLSIFRYGIGRYQHITGVMTLHCSVRTLHGKRNQERFLALHCMDGCLVDIKFEHRRCLPGLKFGCSKSVHCLVERLCNSGIFVIIGPAILAGIGRDEQCYGLVFRWGNGRLHFKTQCILCAKIAECVGSERKDILSFRGRLLLGCGILFFATRGRQGQECT